MNTTQYGPTEQARKEKLLWRENAKRKVRKVLKIALWAGICAVGLILFIYGMRLGMQIDSIQSPIIWREQTKPQSANEAIKPEQVVTPTPVPKVSIINNINFDAEQRQNAELIREAFPNDAQRMIAIAMAESGLRCRSINHNDSNGYPEGHPLYIRVQAVGLFQINDGRVFSDEDIANLTDCRHNIERAKQKYSSQGPYAWGAFTSEAFLKYL